MPLERFRAIARAQHTLARHISVLAYQNLQQARFIQAKNAAEGSNRMLARLLNTSDSIATLKDTSLRYLMVNDEFLRLTGIRSHADVIGKTDREVLANIVKPEDLQRYAEGDRQALALARGSVLTFEERYEWDNGQDRFFQTKKFLVFDDAEEATAVGSLSTEITEVKRIQGRLAKEKARAEAASRAKNEFLANMSHEIRTPLNGINGMMQLLQTTDLDREQEEYVDMAVRSTGRLTRLLTDILDISRIEAGKLEFLRQKFRVRDLTQSVSELFDVTHSQKGVPLLCRIDPDTPDVLVGDEARIRQILFNLVGNAFKFTEKGSITLEIYPVFSPKQDQRRIVFSVHDTGIGIPEDKLRNLFAPFAQVETAYNRNYQGAGLGLAIVRRLATLMGGHIVMDTVPGEGTSAHVVLPFDSPEAAREGQDSAPENAVNALGPLRVLLVEDDQSNRFFMEKLLEKAGATTVTAGNGSEALEFWESENFDCILMDIQMPIMDGVEATKHIRSSQTGTKARIPIVALTSYAMTGDREKFLAVGMDAYLGKPVQFADLLQVLTTVCRPLEQTGRDNLPNVEGE
jgi:PAS domain S-box-containing protein